MLTSLTRADARRVVRETGFIDYRTRAPWIIELAAGGKLVYLRVKGRRQRYVVTIEQLVKAGAANRAAELRAEKLERRRARQRR